MNCIYPHEILHSKVQFTQGTLMSEQLEKKYTNTFYTQVLLLTHLWQTKWKQFTVYHFFENVFRATEGHLSSCLIILCSQASPARQQEGTCRSTGGSLGTRLDSKSFILKGVKWEQRGGNGDAVTYPVTQASIWLHVVVHPQVNEVTVVTFPGKCQVTSATVTY